MEEDFIIAAILLFVMIVFGGYNMPFGCMPGEELSGVRHNDDGSSGNQGDVGIGG